MAKRRFRRILELPISVVTIDELITYRYFFPALGHVAIAENTYAAVRLEYTSSIMICFEILHHVTRFDGRISYVIVLIDVMNHGKRADRGMRCEK